jgi:hypothetical protein
MANGKNLPPLSFAEEAKPQANVKETVEQAYLKLMDEFEPQKNMPLNL